MHIQNKSVNLSPFIERNIKVIYGVYIHSLHLIHVNICSFYILWGVICQCLVTVKMRSLKQVHINTFPVVLNQDKYKV